MAITEGKFLELQQRRLANTSVGPSTVRGMGPGGTVDAARNYLAGIDLSQLAQDSERAFSKRLDRATDEMVRTLPRGARHWGMARKLLNIFLRGATYNRFLCEAYDLQKCDPWLEVPLDSHVALGLRGEKHGDTLPRWKTVIGLTQVISHQYQAFAATVAKEKGIHRVHLDLLYWRQLGRDRPNGRVTREP